KETVDFSTRERVLNRAEGRFGLRSLRRARQQCCNTRGNQCRLAPRGSVRKKCIFQHFGSSSEEMDDTCTTRTLSGDTWRLIQPKARDAPCLTGWYPSAGLEDVDGQSFGGFWKLRRFLSDERTPVGTLIA